MLYIINSSTEAACYPSHPELRTNKQDRVMTDLLRANGYPDIWFEKLNQDKRRKVY